MYFRKKCSFLFLYLFLATSYSFSRVARPPQYISLAFDNCTENERWSELDDFSKELERDGKSVKFTFFVSGVNFIENSNRRIYTAPRKQPGQANIDFGGSTETVKERVDSMHQLYSSGHELASHAVGHFSGLEWSAAEWLSELQFFNKLFKESFTRFGYEDAEEITGKLKGFRAPYLDASRGLYTSLDRLGYRYDTSSPDGEIEAWPKKNGTIWEFPLTSVRIAETGVRTITMDYNFYARQSGAEDDPANYADYYRQMLKTYRNYFTAAYTGNRAPMHIGHHFFNYQGGVYNKALKEFAKTVCGLPEVKCITYNALADFMDSLSEETLSAYKRGDFEKANNPLQ